MARLRVVCWSLILWLASDRALAAEPALHWVRAKGAERCIDPVALAQRVEALIGSVFVPPAVAELSVEGLVEPGGSGFRVRLVSSLRGGARSAERILTSSQRDCRQLDAAITFVIALIIDPKLSFEGVPADVLATFSQERAPEQVLLAELERAPPAPVAAAPTPPVSAPRPASPAPPPALAARAGPRYGFGLAAATIGGNAPGWLGGLRASFALSLAEHVALSLALSAFPSVRAQPVTAERSAVFQSYDATFSACPSWRWGRLRALGCAGIALGYLRAEGREFEVTHSAALWDPAAALALAAELGLAHGFGLFASATLRIRFLSQQFELASGTPERQSAYRPPRFGGMFSIGPSYAF